MGHWAGIRITNRCGPSCREGKRLCCPSKIVCCRSRLSVRYSLGLAINSPGQLAVDVTTFHSGKTLPLSRTPPDSHPDRDRRHPTPNIRLYSGTASCLWWRTGEDCIQPGNWTPLSSPTSLRFDRLSQRSSYSGEVTVPGTYLVAKYSTVYVLVHSCLVCLSPLIESTNLYLVRVPGELTWYSPFGLWRTG